MSLLKIHVSLGGHFKNYQNVSKSDFIEPLQISDQSEFVGVIFDAGVYASSLVTFFSLDFKDFYDEEEDDDGYGKFFDELKSKTGLIKSWLLTREVKTFEDFKNNGMICSMFFNLQIDQDQVDFKLDPEFMTILGERHIHIHLITNE